MNQNTEAMEEELAADCNELARKLRDEAMRRVCRPKSDNVIVECDGRRSRTIPNYLIKREQ